MLTFVFPPPEAATSTAVGVAGVLTVGVLGYCCYVFAAAAVLR